MKIEYLVYYKNKNSNKRVDSQSAYPISKEIYTHLIEHIQTHGEPCDVVGTPPNVVVYLLKLKCYLKKNILEELRQQLTLI